MVLRQFFQKVVRRGQFSFTFYFGCQKPHGKILILAIFFSNVKFQGGHFLLQRYFFQCFSQYGSNMTNNESPSYLTPTSYWASWDTFYFHCIDILCYTHTMTFIINYQCLELLNLLHWKQYQPLMLFLVLINVHIY